MKKFTIQIVVLLVITFAALGFVTSKLPVLNFSPTTQQQTVKLKVGDTTVNVEIADDTDKRKKGLAGRDSLATDSGMLFVYSTPDKYIYWMKGVRFPIDIIWIRENQVVDLLKNVPIPKQGQSDNELPRYTTSFTVDKVLEVNAGFINAHGVKLGDKVETVK